MTEWIQTPALDFVLHDGFYSVWTYENGGPGNSCQGCPFRNGGPRDSRGQLVNFAEVANDPSEAYYLCALPTFQGLDLDAPDRLVWGEYAPCTDEEWKRQARHEVAAHYPARVRGSL